MSYPYPKRADIGRTLLPEPVAPVEPEYGADDQAEMDAFVDAFDRQHEPSVENSTEALDAYDKLCRDVREATSCMQCGTGTTKQEGLLCTPCALQDIEANDEHERDHAPGRV